jgi:VanZ family protein
MQAAGCQEDAFVMPLRFKRFWIVNGIGFVLLVVYLSLTPDPPDLDVPYGMKIGHTFAYCWLMLWFAQIYRSGSARLRLVVAFCAMGILLEFFQGFTEYRTFEYSDMVINSVGVAVGLLLSTTPLQNGLAALESVLQGRVSR